MTRTTLTALIGTYPHTAPLKSGAVSSDRIAFDFIDIDPVWDGFKGMIREQRYDVAEMAIVTYLIARAHGKPFALLPAAMVGRFQHPYAIYNARFGTLAPKDLEGKRVGIRSFTTTTGAWLRGILANDYGVDLDRIDWVTFEDPHVVEYRDATRRAPTGKAIVPMLLEAQRWFARHRTIPINHLIVMRQHDVEADPDRVREVWRLLRAGKAAAKPAPDPDPVPFGIEANRPSLELIAEYAFQQRLIPRRISVDEMFAETRALVGA